MNAAAKSDRFRIDLDISELADEIVSHLPQSVFHSSETKFLDPAYAGGQFLYAVAKRLLKNGHSRENILGRLYGVEYRPIYANSYKIRGLLGANLQIISTLDQLTEVVNNMKFDVILGNPPYQNNHEKDTTSARKVGNKLWYQFAFKAMDLVKDNGYVAMVTPNQWLSGGVQMRKGSLGMIKDIFSVKQTLKAVVSDRISTDYFPKIGISIGWWIVKNVDATESTVFEINSGDTDIDLTKCEFLSPEATTESIGIISKTLLSDHVKFNTYYFNAQCKPGSMNETDEPTKKNMHPHWIRGSKVTDNLSVKYFPKELNNKVGYKKILFPMSSRYWQPHLADKNVNVATLGQALEVAGNTTAKGFQSVFYSKLFTYLNFDLQIKQNGFMKSIFVQNLPYLDMSEVWTDQEIYDHFGLTKTEIEYIENAVG